ncbi:MAG: hypothetical protein JWL97_63 [Gemmatimonadales bacterium]|nr:hypothetical protein [Gemmatimonadales bacterium]
MKRARVFCAALLLLLVGAGATAHAQGDKGKKNAEPAPAGGQHQRGQAPPQDQGKKGGPPAHAQPAAQHQRQQPAQAQVRRPAPQPVQARRQAPQRVQAMRPAPQSVQSRTSATPAQVRRTAPQIAASDQGQRQRAQAEQQRGSQYRQRLNQQVLFSQQQAALLQQQKRNNQYRAEQQYLAQLRQQQQRLQLNRDYSNDPYVRTAPSYRYNYGGVYRETNQYGANALRQAVNYGYQEGVRFGQADRQDGWPANYQNSAAYRDANYGYDGSYIDQSEYNYYFRQGFRRGYADGYNSQSQYGNSLNGTPSILATLLASILGLTSLR